MSRGSHGPTQRSYGFTYVDTSSICEQEGDNGSETEDCQMG